MARIFRLVAVTAIFSLTAVGCAKSDTVVSPGSRNEAASDQPKGEEHPKGEHPKGEHPEGEHPQGEHPQGEESGG